MYALGKELSMETITKTRRGLAGELWQEAGPGSEEPSPPEWRRDSPRRLVHQAVDIRHRGGRAYGHARNVGPDSMCVVAKQRLQCGSAVQVRRAYTDGAEWSRMTVVHCTDTIGGYKVGLASDDR